MIHYLVNYFHIYIVHVGAWATFYGAMTIKDGKEVKLSKMFILSFLLASCSALAHNHYQHFLK